MRCPFIASLLIALALPLTALAHPDDRIVVLRDGADPNMVATRNGVLARLLYRHALRGFAGRIPPPLLARLQADPDVAWIEADAPRQALAQLVPTGVSRIGATLNDVARIDGLDQRVDIDIAIIDTGIDLTHPDLDVVAEASFVDGVASGDDDNGHGTHVAGITAALDDDVGVVGVAPGARLWAVKVLNAQGQGTLSSILAGIDYVTAHAGQIAVANMSLGGVGYSQAERDAIARSVAAGVVYVVAAGNSRADVLGTDHLFATGDDFVPAAYPEVATVSALADSDGARGGLGAATSYGPDDTIASFSNYSRLAAPGNPVRASGAGIDLAAPGVDIYSTYDGGGYATLSGTSMASPHVAGAAALTIAGLGTRDVTGDGAIDAADVAVVRQLLVDAAEPQLLFGPADVVDRYDDQPEFLVNAASGAPAAAIASPADGAAYADGAAIDLAGSASSAGFQDLSAQLVWAARIGGVLGSGARIARALAPDRAHVLTAGVLDGPRPAGDFVRVTVGAPPLLNPTLSFDKKSYGYKDFVTFTARVLVAGQPVAGAVVDVLVLFPPSSNGFFGGLQWTSMITDANGAASSTFKYCCAAGNYTANAWAWSPGLATAKSPTASYHQKSSP